MNNNRNNRRRGRGNRNSQGGGNNQNRIDSRARGNAPQLLDKYKKLAQDAQHNGDRVQMEYYLQFADHYFRVIADNKARQDESRGKKGDGRNDERGQANDDFDDDDDGDNRRQNTRRSRGRQDDDGDDEEVVERQPKRRARKPRAETNGDGAGSDKPKRRKPRATKPNGGEIDSSVLPPSISASSDGDSVKAVG